MLVVVGEILEVVGALFLEYFQGEGVVELVEEVDLLPLFGGDLNDERVVVFNPVFSHHSGHLLLQEAGEVHVEQREYFPDSISIQFYGGIHLVDSFTRFVLTSGLGAMEDFGH